MKAASFSKVAFPFSVCKRGRIYLLFFYTGETYGGGVKTISEITGPTILAAGVVVIVAVLWNCVIIWLIGSSFIEKSDSELFSVRRSMFNFIKFSLRILE